MEAEQQGTEAAWLELSMHIPEMFAHDMKECDDVRSGSTAGSKKGRSSIEGLF